MYSCAARRDKERGAKGASGTFTIVLIFVIIGAVGGSARGTGIADYHVTFKAIWNATDHPYDFPTGSAHFSPLVGATHDPAVTFWQEGSLATVGIQRMAEQGRTKELADEVAIAVTNGTAYSTILGVGTGSPGSATADFKSSPSYPLATLVTMIAPSPDWFVGIAGLNLMADGKWKDKLVVDLYPYDAGTDSGVTFTSANQDSMPHVGISRITTLPFPNTSKLGTFTFDLVREHVLGDANGDGRVDANDYFQIDRGFVTRRMGYSNGDFDLNHKVDSDDYFIIDKAFLTQDVLTAATTHATGVPEPETLALLAFGAVGLATRRRGSGKSEALS
jgi:hypothetical protein